MYNNKKLRKSQQPAITVIIGHGGKPPYYNYFLIIIIMFLSQKMILWQGDFSRGYVQLGQDNEVLKQASLSTQRAVILRN